MAMGAAFGSGEADVETGSLAITSTRVVVESMEVGCVAHSVVLGLTLGLQKEVEPASILLVCSCCNGT